MMRERWEMEQYDQSKKQISVASRVVNRLVNLPGMSVEEIGLAQAAVEQTLPQMPTVTPDLKLSTEEVDVAMNQLRLAEKSGLLEPELYQRLRVALNGQREISLDRPLSYRQRLIQSLDSKLVFLNRHFSYYRWGMVIAVSSVNSFNAIHWLAEGQLLPYFSQIFGVAVINRIAISKTQKWLEKRSLKQ